MSSLSDNLISEFVESAMPAKEERNHEFTVNGTVASVDNNGVAVVYLDGGDANGTPCQATVGCSAGDRVIVSFKNREPVVTSNITSPTTSVAQLNAEVANINTVMAQKATITQLNTEVANINNVVAQKATITQLNTEVANINTVVAQKATINYVDTKTVNAVNVFAQNGTFKGALSAATGDFKGKVAFTFKGPNTYSQDIYINDTARNSGIYLKRTGSSYGTLETFIDAGYIELAQSKPSRSYSINSQSSDRRQKENIAEIDSDIALRLKPVQFQFKGDDAICYGFIAQDVEDVIPNAVSINERTGYLMLNYHELIAPTLALAQRNNSVIESLIKRVEQLERKVKELET